MRSHEGICAERGRRLPQRRRDHDVALRLLSLRHDARPAQSVPPPLGAGLASLPVRSASGEAGSPVGSGTSSRLIPRCVGEVGTVTTCGGASAAADTPRTNVRRTAEILSLRTATPPGWSGRSWTVVFPMTAFRMHWSVRRRRAPAPREAGNLVQVSGAAPARTMSRSDETGRGTE